MYLLMPLNRGDRLIPASVLPETHEEEDLIDMRTDSASLNGTSEAEGMANSHSVMEDEGVEAEAANVEQGRHSAFLINDFLKTKLRHVSAHYADGSRVLEESLNRVNDWVDNVFHSRYGNSVFNSVPVRPAPHAEFTAKAQPQRSHGVAQDLTFADSNGPVFSDAPSRPETDLQSFQAQAHQQEQRSPQASAKSLEAEDMDTIDDFDDGQDGTHFQERIEGKSISRAVSCRPERLTLHKASNSSLNPNPNRRKIHDALRAVRHFMPWEDRSILRDNIDKIGFTQVDSLGLDEAHWEMNKLGIIVESLPLTIPSIEEQRQTLIQRFMACQARELELSREVFASASANKYGNPLAKTAKSDSDAIDGTDESGGANSADFVEPHLVDHPAPEPSYTQQEREGTFGGFEEYGAVAGGVFSGSRRLSHISKNVRLPPYNFKQQDGDSNRSIKDYFTEFQKVDRALIDRISIECPRPLLRHPLLYLPKDCAKIMHGYQLKYKGKGKELIFDGSDVGADAGASNRDIETKRQRPDDDKSYQSSDTVKTGRDFYYVLPFEQATSAVKIHQHQFETSTTSPSHISSSNEIAQFGIGNMEQGENESTQDWLDRIYKRGKYADPNALQRLKDPNYKPAIHSAGGGSEASIHDSSNYGSTYGDTMEEEAQPKKTKADIFSPRFIEPRGHSPLNAKAPEFKFGDGSSAGRSSGRSHAIPIRSPSPEIGTALKSKFALTPLDNGSATPTRMRHEAPKPVARPEIAKFAASPASSVKTAVTAPTPHGDKSKVPVSDDHIPPSSAFNEPTIAAATDSSKIGNKPKKDPFSFAQDEFMKFINAHKK